MRVRFLMFLACLAAALLLPVSAFAAPSTIASMPATVVAPVGVMEAQVWPGAETGKLVVIVSLRLPEGAGLPALARIPIPNGMVTDWTGEIAGDSTDTDLSRQFRVVKGKGGSYVEFMASQSLLVQAEFSSLSIVEKGKQVSAKVDFVQSVPASMTSFSVRLPANTKLVSMEPKPQGVPDRNDVGEILYVLPDLKLATGQKTSVSVAFDNVGITPLPKSGPDTLTIALWMLGALLVITVLGLALVMSRKRMGSDET